MIFFGGEGGGGERKEGGRRQRVARQMHNAILRWVFANKLAAACTGKEATYFAKQRSMWLKHLCQEFAHELRVAARAAEDGVGAQARALCMQLILLVLFLDHLQIQR